MFTHVFGEFLKALPLPPPPIHVARRYNIFDEAIAEVLHVMEANFKADFERTMEFRELSKAVEREARELQVLRQARSAPHIPIHHQLTS